MAEPSSSAPSTSKEPPKPGISGANKREFSVQDDWKIFQQLKERLDTESDRSSGTVPEWLKGRVTLERWKKLSVLEKWRLRREAKASGSLSTVTANDLLARNAVQSSKITETLGNVPIRSVPALLIEDKHSGALRRVDLFEEEGVAGDDDDAGERTRGLPDWAIPKDRLLRSFFQYRAELDLRTEERLLRDSFMIFDDDPLMSTAPPADTPAKPEIFRLKPLKMTTVEWDDWKKEKPIPVVQRVNPSHDMVKNRKRVEGKYAKYSEHMMRPSEIAKLRDGGVNDENPLFFWNRNEGSSLEGRSYFMANEFHRTTKLAKLAIAILKKKGVALTKESIEHRMRNMDSKLSAMRRKLTGPKTTKKKKKTQPSTDAPSTSKTPESAQPITVSIPKETPPKGSEVLSPDSPSKRVLPARTRRPTAKEAERREDEKKEREKAVRRSRDKGSKDRESQQPSPAAGTVAAPAAPVAPAARLLTETPEKERTESVNERVAKVAKKKEKQPTVTSDEPRRRRGFAFDGDDEEEETVGRTKDGENIVLVKRGETGWSIRFDKPAGIDSEKSKGIKHPSIVDDVFSDEDDDVPSTEELVKYHPSELIMHRDRWGQPRLAPRCCLADMRDGQWVACKRPGRNDFMSASLAKRAYEMDLNIAWRHEAANQRICQLHSRLLRTAGEGGNILEEMIPWMGRRRCTDLEKQLVGPEKMTAFAELEREENKWLNWGKPVSTQILMQRMKEINRKARRLVYALRNRKKRKAVKRVRRVPKGMKKQTRLFEYAKFILERINIEEITETEIASLSGKERRTLAELLRVNKKRIDMERYQMDKILKRRDKREGITRPMTPLSCPSVAGGASEFEKVIGPLIACMVRRPLDPGVGDVRPIKRREEKRQEVVRARKAKRKIAKRRKTKKKSTKGKKKSIRRKKSKKKIITLKSGELFNLTKYRAMRKKMRPLIKEMKSTPAQKERAIESLLGKRVPGLGLAIRKEKKQREFAMLEKFERVRVSLALLNKEKKKVKTEFVVIGVMRDHVVKRLTMLRDPFFFLAYRRKDKAKKIVKLMPVLPQRVMRNVKTRELKGLKVVDLTKGKDSAKTKKAVKSSQVQPRSSTASTHEKKKDEGDEPMLIDLSSEAKKEELKGHKEPQASTVVMEVDQSISEENKDDDVVILGVTKRVIPPLKIREESKRLIAEEEARERKKAIVLEEQKKETIKKSRWIRKSIDRRIRLYTRPDVIVVRRKETIEQLGKVKRICLKKILSLPNFDRMLDEIVEKSLKKLCTQPARRKVTEADVDYVLENTYEKRLRELWMEEIDRSLRFNGFLPPNVPDEYIEERAEELEERMKFAIEVEEALLHEERRQRLDDAAAAAYAAIDEDSDDGAATTARRRPAASQHLIGDPSGSAPLAARTDRGKLLQLQSAYDRLKDERTYWSAREDERWREKKKFVPPRRPLLPDDVYDEVHLPVKEAAGNGKLTSLPKGVALFETPATKSIGRVKTGRKIPLKLALRKIDTSSLTIPQMKKLITGLKKLKGQRERRVSRSKKNKIKKLRQRNKSSRANIKKKTKGKTTVAPSDQGDDEPESDTLLPSQSTALLEWSLAPPSVEEIKKELEEHGQDMMRASEEELRRSIARLRQLKKTIYEQLRPLGDGEEQQEPMTVKIGIVKESTAASKATASKAPKLPQKPVEIVPETKRNNKKKGKTTKKKRQGKKEEKQRKSKRKSLSRREETERPKKRKLETDQETDQADPQRKKKKRYSERHPERKEEKMERSDGREDKEDEKRKKRDTVESEEKKEDSKESKRERREMRREKERREKDEQKEEEKEMRKKKEKEESEKIDSERKGRKEERRKTGEKEKKREVEVEETKEERTKTRKSKKESNEQKKTDAPAESSKKKLYVVRLRKKGKKSGAYDWADIDKKATEKEKIRYREQKKAAIDGREAMMRDEEEVEKETRPVEVPKKRKKKRQADEEIVLDDEGNIIAKKKKKQVDPTGFSLLPTRSIYRYRDRFGLPKDEDDSRAALVFGAQMHFNKLEGSANAIPYFVQTLKSGGNYLDERDAQHLRKMLERQRVEAEQLAAAGLQPATPPPARGTRYRVAANQQKQLLKEAENDAADDDDSQ